MGMKKQEKGKHKWRLHLLSRKGAGFGIFLADDKIATSEIVITRGCT